ncbi:transposable element Tc3 transposase [Trichonephila clavipes]|nr:transposable element Tc3 transposase [Trichonephila clavipes]
MEENARPHRTLAVEELLESEDITGMERPAYSPDLNPIEHVWDALERRIAARLHHPENTQQLKQMLTEEWALLPTARNVAPAGSDVRNGKPRVHEGAHLEGTGEEDMELTQQDSLQAEIVVPVVTKKPRIPPFFCLT